MKYSALLRPASSSLSIDMRMTTRVANAVRTLKKTANPSYAAIPSKIAFPLSGAETPARRIAAPTPSRARNPGAEDVFRFDTTWSTTSRRIVAVTASSGRKYGRLPRLPRSISDHRLHEVDQAHRGGVQQVQDRHRPDADDQHEDPQWSEAEDLPGVDLLHGGVLRVQRSEENPLQRPQVEGGYEDDPHGRHDHDGAERLEGAEEDHLLGDESGQPRQAERCEEGEGDEAGVNGHHGAQPPETVDLAVVRPVVDHADQEEEHGRDQAMREHLHRRPRHPEGGERRHAEQNEPHVADGGVG